jgi:DNA-binding transcriptional LysR family regulator
MLAFVRAAECRSFVTAGRLLGVSSSAIGKSVMRLEEKLGVRLFNRSTRHISLTEEGALFFDRCRRILEDIENAELELTKLTDSPRGRLRVSMPAVGYRLLMPVLPAFCRAYPNIELELDFSDRLVDVIEEGFDMVIRSGDLNDSRLMARRLRPFRFVLCGAPAYFAERGTPARVQDLAHHACLRFRYPSNGKLQEWSLPEAGAPLDLQLPSTTTFSNVEAVLCAAIGGMGIACLPDFVADEALRDGRLTMILQDPSSVDGMFWMLWPSNRYMVPKLRVLVDFLSSRLTPAAA